MPDGPVMLTVVCPACGGFPDLPGTGIELCPVNWIRLCPLPSSSALQVKGRLLVKVSVVESAVAVAPAHRSKLGFFTAVMGVGAVARCVVFFAAVRFVVFFATLRLVDFFAVLPLVAFFVVLALVVFFVFLPFIPDEPAGGLS